MIIVSSSNLNVLIKAGRKFMLTHGRTDKQTQMLVVTVAGCMRVGSPNVEIIIVSIDINCSVI
jgi:hypothetical protein